LARQVRLMLHGREFTVHTLADETHLESVAQYVSSKCQEAERSVLSKSPTSIFALTALNIASDHLQPRKSYELLLERMDQNQKKLASVAL
jgi:cell division protein ZapA (FtsZ GTPase activity inhibitor)